MNYYLFKPETIMYDPGFLAKVIEKNSISDLHIYQHPAACVRDMLFNLQSPSVLVLYIDKKSDIEEFASIKNLISDVPLFVILSSPDSSLLHACQKLRPKIVCRKEQDISDMFQVIQKIATKQNMLSES